MHTNRDARRAMLHRHAQHYLSYASFIDGDGSGGRIEHVLTTMLGGGDIVVLGYISSHNLPRETE